MYLSQRVHNISEVQFDYPVNVKTMLKYNLMKTGKFCSQSDAIFQRNRQDTNAYIYEGSIGAPKIHNIRPMICRVGKQI